MSVQKIIHVTRDIDLVDLIAAEFPDEDESEIIDRIDQGQVTLNGDIGHYGWIAYRGDEVTIAGRLPHKQYSSPPQKIIDLNMVYTATINTNLGTMTARLLPTVSPVTVNNFVFLANDRFFDNTSFHYLLSDLYVRGGCPVGDGSGGPGYWIPDETTNRRPSKGTIAMAEHGPDKSSSQFVIFLRDTPIPFNTTEFGTITYGLDVLNQIANTQNDRGKPTRELKIISIRIDSTPKQFKPSAIDQASFVPDNQQSISRDTSVKSGPVHIPGQASIPTSISEPTKTLIVDTNWVEVTIESEMFVEVTRRRYTPALLVKLKGETMPFKWYVGASSIKDPLEAIRKLNNNLFSGLRLRIRKKNADDSIKFAVYEIESVEHPSLEKQDWQAELDELPIKTIVGPEFTQRMRDKLLTNKDALTVGDLRKFLLQSESKSVPTFKPKAIQLNTIFNYRGRQDASKTALDRFDDTSGKWFSDVLSNDRVSWLLPKTYRESQTESPQFFKQLILDMPGLPANTSNIVNEWTTHTSWFPMLSLELIQTIQKMRLADRNMLRTSLEQLSAKLSGGSIRGPWELDFPELSKATPVFVLFEFNPTEPFMRLLSRLSQNGCTCIGHLSILERESLDSIDNINDSTWLAIYRRLNMRESWGQSG